MVWIGVNGFGMVHRYSKRVPSDSYSRETRSSGGSHTVGVCSWLVFSRTRHVAAGSPSVTVQASPSRLTAAGLPRGAPTAVSGWTRSARACKPRNVTVPFTGSLTGNSFLAHPRPSYGSDRDGGGAVGVQQEIPFSAHPRPSPGLAGVGGGAGGQGVISIHFGNDFIVFTAVVKKFRQAERDPGPISKGAYR